MAFFYIYQVVFHVILNGKRSTDKHQHIFFTDIWSNKSILLPFPSCLVGCPVCEQVTLSQQNKNKKNRQTTNQQSPIDWSATSHIFSHIGPLYHKTPAEIPLPGDSKRVYVVGLLTLSLFWYCTKDSYRTLAHFDKIVYPLGRQQPLRLSRLNIEEGVLGNRTLFFGRNVIWGI